MLDSLNSIEVCVDNRIFDLKTKIRSCSEDNIVIVSFVPNDKAKRILELCIDSLEKFTDGQYSIWVIDNNSPVENIKWLVDRQVNLVLNRIEPALNMKSCGTIKEQHPWHYASYANGVAIEIARNLFDSSAKRIFTMHQDTSVCKKGWLSYLQSKLSEKVKASGVRLDKQRSSAGRLHVLGLLSDISALNKFGIDFLPELPEYDAGDKISDELRRHSFELFSARNTVWDRSLIDRIPANSLFKNLEVDRSLDDDGEVFFLHLGRGTLKATDRYQQKPGIVKATADEYIEAVARHLWT